MGELRVTSEEFGDLPFDKFIAQVMLEQPQELTIYGFGVAPKDIRHITRGIAEIATSHTFLRMICFYGFCDEGIKNIATELPCKSSLTRLSVNGEFRDEGLKAVFQAIKGSSITTLLLDSLKKIGEEGMQALSQGLVSSSIIRLSFSGHLGDQELEFFCTGLEKTQIIDFTLHGVFGDQGVQYLCHALKKLKLEKLVLAGVFGDQGVKYLCHALEKSKIEYLELQGRYGDIGVQHLCNIIEKSKIEIEKLNLRGSYGDKGIFAVLSIISNGKVNFNELSLGGKASSHTFHILFKTLKHNKTIEYLRLPDSNDDFKIALPCEWLEDCFSENFTLMVVQNSSWPLLEQYATRNRICNELGAGKLFRDSIPLNLQYEDDMKAFVKELQKNSQLLRSMKLIVLGNGQIGKTTLLCAIHNILDPTHQKDLSQITSTVGIEQTTFNIANGEISVWDFAGQMEYTATHSFFLSMEMTSILVCFNLALSNTEQKQQITFWLNFLNSSHSLPHSASANVPKWNIILVGVRQDEQTDFSISENAHFISSWKRKWPRLPIVAKLFTVSSLKSQESVKHLFAFVEQECATIIDQHATQTPVSYYNFCTKLPTLVIQYPLIQWHELFDKVKDELNMDVFGFKTMLQYLHAIGQIIWLPNGSVFANPTSASKIAAKFISPKEVREKLLKLETDKVQILDEKDIGCLLEIDTSQNERLHNELELLMHLKICFPLHTLDSKSILYLFPSLSSETTKLAFSPNPNTLSSNSIIMAGVRLIAPNDLVFVRGFLCQFLITIFMELNIYRDNIQIVCVNGAKIQCPGLFYGELIVMIEPYDKSIIIAMNASDPDTIYITDIFDQLIQKSFMQYTGYNQEVLCSECLKMAFFDLSIIVNKIGVLRQKSPTCSTQKHPVAPPIPSYLQHGEKCKAHNSKVHDIFLNYRVKCEGNKSSSTEPEKGVVEQLYKTLAVKKTKKGESLFVFWDCKCLNDGKNWEMGFEHGVQYSKVIILLISATTMNMIVANAANHQDNVLIEYECALLLSKLYGVRVFPVFLAELQKESKQKLIPFGFNFQFPDAPHKRDPSSQSFINKISHTMPESEKCFLASIKYTMSEIFKLQGIKMPNRIENKKEVQDLINKIIELVEISHSVHPRFLSTLMPLPPTTTSISTTSTFVTPTPTTPTPTSTIQNTTIFTLMTVSAVFTVGAVLWLVLRKK